MAKKSGSLFGRADAALVQAAFAEGRTKGPADFTGIYKEMGESFSLMADDLLKEAKETYEAIYQDDIALKEKMGTAYEMIQNGNFTDDERGQIFDFSEDYREKFKEINKIKDKKERKKAEIALNAEFNSFLKNMPLMETELAKIATFVANDQHVAGGMDGRFGNTNTENTNFLIGIADFHNKVDDPQFKTTRTIEKGNVFYEVEVGNGKKIKLNQNDIGKLLPVEDHNAKQVYDAIHATQQKAGGTEGASYNKDSVINDVYQIVAKSKNAADTWQTLSRYKGQFNKESFYDALMNPYSSVGQEIKVALENANLPKQFDVGGEVGIDESDFLNKENFTKIKKYIMNNPRFGAKVMGEWSAATSAKGAYDYGNNILQIEINKRNQKNKIDKNKDKFYASDMQFEGGVTSNTLNGYLTSLYNGTITNPIDGLVYNMNKDKSWSTKDGKKHLTGTEMIMELQKNELQKRGWEFDENNKTTTRGDNAFFFTEEKQFQPFRGSSRKKNDIDNPLQTEVRVENLTEEDFNEVVDAQDIMNIAQKAINNKDALISERTDIQGVSSGVSMRTGFFNSQRIVLIDGSGNEYKFDFGKRGANRLKDLPSFIEQLNSLLEVKEINTEFKDQN
tara:strand:- start:1863 stop:3722 length:1860 start_codon:yes stop_codon:yes gene_type:complete